MFLLGNKLLVTSLLYRGSTHGWRQEEFHSRCDKKGPTISLFKINMGDCIGGYTKASWSSPPNICGELISDSDAVLFNLTCGRQYPHKNTGKAIYCSKYKGP